MSAYRILTVDDRGRGWKLIGVLAECRSTAAVLALPALRNRSGGDPRPLERAQALLLQGCGRIFNALTCTPLARLRKKELWAAFAASLSDGDTVKAAAV